MTFDRERLRIAVQALEDHCHTVLEAHAEAPPHLMTIVRNCAFTLAELTTTLETNNDDTN